MLNDGSTRRAQSRRLLLVALIVLITVLPAAAVLQAAPRTPHASEGPGRAYASSVPTGPVASVPNSTVPYGRSDTVTGDSPLDARGPYMENGSYRGSHNLKFAWDFVDVKNQSLTGYKPSYVWWHTGIFNVHLTVSDIVTGANDSTTFTVTVVPRVWAGPDRVVNEFSNKTLINFTAGAWDDNDITEYLWSFDYGGTNHLVYEKNWSFNFTKPGKYAINLTVTDDIGLSWSDSLNVTVNRIPTFYEKNWFMLFVVLPIVAIICAWVGNKVRRDRALFTPTDIEKAKLQWKSLKKTWKIFKANRLGFGGLIVLIAFTVVALSAPWISTVPAPNNTQHFEPTILKEGWINPLPPSFSRSPHSGYIHPFGTDHQGQDIYSLTMYGARASLEVGLVATFISVMLGAMVGLTAGYFGRIADETLMRVTDFFLVLPWFPLMIVMMAILGRQFIWVIIVIGITSWPSTARVVRAQVLTVKERQFIVRARAVGAGDGHIIKTHILPNVLPIIFANTVLLIANAIFSESFLDFFGLGDSRIISWGSMLEGAYEQSAFLQGAWWWIAAPGAAIVLMVLAFSMVGYAIDDVLNPKLRRR